MVRAGTGSGAQMSPGTLLRNIRPDDGAGEAGHQDSTRRPERHPRYGVLLLVLMVSYVLSAFAQGKWVAAVQVGLFLGVSLLAVRTERIKRRVAQWVAGVAIAGSALAVALALNRSETDTGLAYCWSALMLLFAVAVIVRRVLAQPEVSLQSIYGAVSAYVIIGLMFAAVYGAINQFTAGDFFVQISMPTLKTFQYFSFTTLTTLGYGDYTTAQSGGQAIAVMEAVAGQIFLATLVARLVAGFRGASLRQQARSAAQPGPPQTTGSPNQASQAQPASPGEDPAQGGAVTRVSPRARARQARRSHLRPG
jgi:Ion channel